MSSRRHPIGFSLIEVIMAIAIVGGGVAVVLGFLPKIAQRSADWTDAQTALRMVGAVTVQLETESAGGLDALVGAIPVMQVDADIGRRFVAARDGTDFRLESGARAKDQYFLIVVRKYGAGALAYDGGGVMLAVNVMVSWPYRLPTGDGLTAALVASDRRNVSFNVAVNR